MISREQSKEFLCMKNKILLTGTAVLLAVLLLGFVPFRREIEKTIPVRVTESTGAVTESEMHINGIYSFTLFLPDRFEGSMEIAAFPETTGRTVEIRVADVPSDVLVCRRWQGSRLDSLFFGYIRADSAMNRAVILKAADGVLDLTGADNCVILAGDASPEDAAALLESIRQHGEEP